MTPKTEMIRVRVTPEEKQAWESQVQAEGANGLSELIRQRMNSHMAPAPRVAENRNVEPAEASEEEYRICADGYACLAPDCSCGSKAKASASCPHGKPKFVYCPDCDQ